MADTVNDVYTLARGLLNEEQGTPQVYTDATLLPLVKSAYRRLQRKLALNGVTRTRTRSTLTLAQGDSEFSDASTPALPADFILPHRLWERPNGTTEKFVDMSQRHDGLEDLDPTQNLLIWEWRDDKILFIGSTRAIDVKMLYEKSLPALVNGSSPILIRDAVDCLASGTAALASRPRGEAPLAKDYGADFEDSAAEIVKRYVRADQRKPARRRAYGRRWRGYPLYT